MKTVHQLEKLYRVVEITRGTDGRLRDVASVWHPDLEKVRAAAKQIATNTMAHEIWIATPSIARLERIDLPWPPFTVGQGILAAATGAAPGNRPVTDR